MGLPCCRQFDPTIGYCSVCKTFMSGRILTGSPNVLVNARGVARNTDVVMAYCGHIGIITANSTVRVNGLSAACIGDAFTGTYYGTLNSGSENVMV